MAFKLEQALEFPGGLHKTDCQGLASDSGSLESGNIQVLKQH
jgi:hypothetical protein